MGVHGTFCQLCGLPTQHDHYVRTRSQMLKIYRASSDNGGHTWEPDEKPFRFGSEHAWLMDAVVLPWDEERVLRGPIEDGVLEGVMVFQGDDDGLAFHHACWMIQGSPGSTGPAIRATSTHGWALVEGYHQQLFDFDGLAADGKKWMLDEPKIGTRSRARIDELLAIARNEVTETATNVEEIIQLDRDWSCMAVRDQDGARKAIARARTYAIERVNKDGYGTLVRTTRFYDERTLPGAEVMSALEAFEVALKSAVEARSAACLAVVAFGKGRVEFLTYARDGATTKAAIEALPGARAARFEVSRDPDWESAVKTIKALAR
jgi:hypothetical protein